MANGAGFDVWRNDCHFAERRESCCQRVNAVRVDAIVIRYQNSGHHLFRGAVPLGLPHTLSREPLRRLAPFPPALKLRRDLAEAPLGAKAGAWLASLRSLASFLWRHRAHAGG